MNTYIAKKRNWFTLLSFFFGISVILLSCNTASIFQPSTPTPTTTPTFTATSTPSPTSTETPTQTPTAEPTISIPSGTPMSIWNRIPILPDALAAEGKPEEKWYSYITQTDQDNVLDYYLQQLPSYGWEISGVTPNDRGGYIIFREDIFEDFIYIFEDAEHKLTFVEIYISRWSPSRNP